MEKPIKNALIGARFRRKKFFSYLYIVYGLALSVKKAKRFSMGKAGGRGFHIYSRARKLPFCMGTIIEGEFRYW
jgi:hypothetical protein